MVLMSITSVEIKDLNALIDNKPVFDQPVKNKQETKEQLIKMSRNNYYTTGNFLNYLNHQKIYKLIGINLSRQKIFKKVFLNKLILWEN